MSRDEYNNIIITDSKLILTLPPQLHNISAQYKVMSGFEFCISVKSIHSSLLSWRHNYVRKLKDLSQNAKSKGLVKFLIAYLSHVKILRCHMGFISMQQHLTCSWQKCVHIHHPNIHCWTGNVCCVVVLNSYALIFQTNNCIVVIQKYLLKHIFMFIT